MVSAFLGWSVFFIRSLHRRTAVRSPCSRPVRQRDVPGAVDRIMSHHGSLTLSRTRFRISQIVSTSAVHSDCEILCGTSVFVGTRVPLQNLIDYLE